MAYQTGNIKYRGSFKSIRQWRIAHDKKTYAGEKGGATRELVMYNTSFARTRENMAEFQGCGLAVKVIRKGLYNLLPEHADTRFTGRLVALVKMINLMDDEGLRGKRGLCFSANKPTLKSLTLHEKRKIDFQLKRSLTNSYPESRTEATITVNGLNPDPTLIPVSARYYRVINHLSIIPDFVYDEKDQEYKPLGTTDASWVIAYSEFTRINTPLTATLKAAFSTKIVPTDTDTVLQCAGIEFYTGPGADRYRPYTSGTMLVYDVF
ncbi:MAG: hypothetical protein Q8908_10320 [Bacteroidota bacterium]|nr:hypothetical protein [Bacteroidota bacterium]